MLKHFFSAEQIGRPLGSWNVSELQLVHQLLRSQQSAATGCQFGSKLVLWIHGTAGVVDAAQAVSVIVASLAGQEGHVQLEPEILSEQFGILEATLAVAPDQFSTVCRPQLCISVHFRSLQTFFAAVAKYWCLCQTIATTASNAYEPVVLAIEGAVRRFSDAQVRPENTIQIHIKSSSQLLACIEATAAQLHDLSAVTATNHSAQAQAAASAWLMLLRAHEHTDKQRILRGHVSTMLSELIVAQQVLINLNA